MTIHAYSILYVRTNALNGSTELTTRARLRNAAIEMFAIRGFETSVREIAKHAGVTAGLITHHFGSKQRLREECDAEVLTQYSALKSSGVTMSPTQSMAMMAELEDYAPMLVYILRSVREGGPLGVTFLETMIAETIKFTEEGVESGLIRPSRDPAARARFMVTTSFGGLLLQLTLLPQCDLSDIGATMRKLVEDTTLPTLELYTEGILTDRRYLDEYLLYVGDPPGGAESSIAPAQKPMETTT